MLQLFLGILLFTNATYPQLTCHSQDHAANLTVSTRTGGFVGDLNDTYPDVRQFKNIPYAKVSSLWIIVAKTTDIFSATSWAATVDITTTPGKLLCDLRFHCVWSCVSTVCLSNTDCMGSEHHWQPCRELW